MVNVIAKALFYDLSIPQNPPKPFLEFALGDPNKANGFNLPQVMNDAVIEAVQS